MRAAAALLIALLCEAGAGGMPVLAGNGAKKTRPLQKPAPRQAAPKPAPPRTAPQPQTPQRHPAEPDAAPEAEEPDISFTATITARELRYETVPRIKVEFFGQPKRKTLNETDRENLPREPQAGVVYRDIGLRIRIHSMFEDLARLLADPVREAPARKGESPKDGPTAPGPTAPEERKQK